MRARLVLASIAAVLALQLVDAGLLRMAATLWFLAVTPGLALAPALPRGEPVARAALLVAVSLSVDTAVTTGLLVAGAYDPATALVAIAAVSALAVGARGAREGGAVIRVHG